MLVRMMKNLFSVRGLHALCFNLVLAAASAHAADYYVSTSGSDSNPGTSAQPFRTITHAYSSASAGTTIHVASGTYSDYTSGWGIHLATGSGVVINNNLTYGNGYGNLDFTGGSSKYSYTQSGNIVADPRMVKETSSSLDPHLVSGSPCIQAGL